MSRVVRESRNQRRTRKGLDPVYIAALFLVMLFAASYLYDTLRPRPQLASDNTLVVYSTKAFMNPVFGFVALGGRRALLIGFEDRNNVNITFVDNFNDAADMVKQSTDGRVRRPDVYIGIDNLSILNIDKERLLEEYRPSNLSKIQEWLITSLDPTLHVVPYAYVPLVALRDDRYLKPDSFSSLDDLAKPDLTELLALPSPVHTELGRHILAWQAVLYDKLLKRDWKEWWLKVAKRAAMYDSEGKTYDSFLAEQYGRRIILGRATDHFLISQLNATIDYITPVPLREGVDLYSWVIVYGAGIDKTSTRKELAKKFIDHLLALEVQKFIPDGDLKFPANSDAPLTPRYSKTIAPESLRPVNSLIMQGELRSRLGVWLTEWEKLRLSG